MRSVGEAFFVGLVVLFLFFAMIVNGYQLGCNNARRQIQKQAIEVGVAQHNPITGCFEWIPPQKE